MGRDSGLVAVALCAAVVFFLGLGDGSLDNDPVVYAAVARGMVESGDWLSMSIGSEPYYNKPPLLFWLTAALFRLAGPSTFTACFWSAAFAAATCVALYRLGRELLGPSAAFLGAFVLMWTFDFVSFNTRFRLDSACAFFLVLALREALAATRSASAQPLARAGLWIGLCFLAKGGPGLIALACVLAFLTWSGGLSLLGSRAAALGAAALVVLALFWPAVQWLRHGTPYVEQGIGTELIARFGETNPGHRSYAAAVAERYWPWLPFLLLGAWRLARDRRRHAEALRLLVSWIAIALSLLLLIPVQYGRYLTILWPAFALVVGHWFAEVLRPAWLRRLRVALPALVLAGAAALAIRGAPLHVDRAEPARQLDALLVAAGATPGEVVSYRESHPFWRAQFLFYLDRDLRVLDTPEQLEDDPPPLLVSRREAAAALEARGWRPSLRTRRWTAYRRPAGESAAGTLK